MTADPSRRADDSAAEEANPVDSGAASSRDAEPTRPEVPGGIGGDIAIPSDDSGTRAADDAGAAVDEHLPAVVPATGKPPIAECAAAEPPTTAWPSKESPTDEPTSAEPPVIAPPSAEPSISEQLPDRRSRRRRSLRGVLELILLVLLLGVLAGALWLRLTPEGQEVWIQMSAAWAELVGDPAAERAVADELQRAGALVIVESGGHVTSVSFIPAGDQRQVDPRLIERLVQCPNLGTINLSGMAINDDHLAAIGRLSSLVCVQLSGTPVGDSGVARLAKLKDLTAMHLVETSVSDEGLKAISRLPSLAILDLRRTRVTDAGLKHLAPLRHLQHLLLSGRGITDEGLDALLALAELKRLTLEDTAVSAEGLARLRRAIPQLSVDLWTAEGEQADSPSPGRQPAP